MSYTRLTRTARALAVAIIAFMIAATTPTQSHAQAKYVVSQTPSGFPIESVEMPNTFGTGGGLVLTCVGNERAFIVLLEQPMLTDKNGEIEAMYSFDGDIDVAEFRWMRLTAKSFMAVGPGHARYLATKLSSGPVFRTAWTDTRGHAALGEYNTRGFRREAKKIKACTS